MTTYAVSRSPSVCTILSDIFSGYTNYKLSLNQEVIELSSDDSARWGEILAGHRSWSMEIEGLYIYTDLAQIYLEQHLTDEEPERVVLAFTPVDEKVFQGNGLVATIYCVSSFEDAIKINVDIRGTGLLVATES